MSVDFFTELARIAVELVERTALIPAVFFRASLRRPLVLPPFTCLADLGVAEGPHRHRSVRRESSSLPPERPVSAMVPTELGVERQSNGPFPQQTRIRIFDGPKEPGVEFQKMLNDFKSFFDKTIGEC